MLLMALLLLLLPPPPASERVEDDGLAAASPASPAAVPLVCNGQVHGEAELVLVLMRLVLLRDGNKNTLKLVTRITNKSGSIQHGDLDIAPGDGCGGSSCSSGKRVCCGGERVSSAARSTSTSCCCCWTARRSRCCTVQEETFTISGLLKMQICFGIFLNIATSQHSLKYAGVCKIAFNANCSIESHSCNQS